MSSADLAAMGHPHGTECSHLSPRGRCPQAHLLAAASLGPLQPLMHIRTRPSPPPPRPWEPHLGTYAWKGIFPRPAEVGSPCRVWPSRSLATCLLSPPPLPLLNPLSGLVPLAPAPGCSLPALRPCPYVPAAAEFWGGQISPFWRPSKELVAAALGKTPKDGQHHSGPGLRRL